MHGKGWSVLVSQEALMRQKYLSFKVANICWLQKTQLTAMPPTPEDIMYSIHLCGVLWDHAHTATRMFTLCFTCKPHTILQTCSLSSLQNTKKLTLSVPVAISRHIIDSFHVFLAQKGFIGNWISLCEMHQWEVHWGKECLLIGGCQLNGLRETSGPFCWHPPIYASPE